MNCLEIWDKSVRPTWIINKVKPMNNFIFISIQLFSAGDDEAKWFSCFAIEPFLFISSMLGFIPIYMV